MSEPDQLAHFRRAVRAIYESHDNEERVRAEEWLETWRSQSAAWQAAATILDDSGSTEDERFMAAQTLRTKVNYATSILIAFGVQCDPFGKRCSCAGNAGQARPACCLINDTVGTVTATPLSQYPRLA